MSKYRLKIILILIITSLISSCAIFGEPTEVDETTGLTDYEVLKKLRQLNSQRIGLELYQSMKRPKKNFQTQNLHHSLN